MSDEQVIAIMAAIIKSVDRLAAETFYAAKHNQGHAYPETTYDDVVAEARSLMDSSKHVPSIETEAA